MTKVRPKQNRLTADNGDFADAEKNPRARLSLSVPSAKSAVKNSESEIEPESSACPRGWRISTGREIFTLIRGVTYNKSDASNEPGPGKVAVLRAGNIQDSRLNRDDLVFVPESCVSKQQRLRAGDFIVAMSSGSKSIVGKIGMVEKDDPHASFGAFCAVIRPITEVVDWLLWYFQTNEYRRYIYAQSAGVNINNLRPEHLLGIRIPLPPLAEQRRIVARLEALEARSRRARALLAEVPAQLAQARQSLLAAAFRGDLTARSLRSDFSGWPRTRLGELVIKMGSGATPRGGRENYHVKGIPLIRSMNVRFEGFTAAGLAFLDDAQADALKSVEVAADDVLFNITGASIGRVCIAPAEMSGARVNQRVMRIRPTDKLLGKFLAAFLASTEMQNFVFQNEAGATRQALTKKQIENFEIPLPPLSEQHKIVRRLTAALARLDAAARAHAAAVAELDRLDQSLLARAFSGTLVPQDPADEPACLPEASSRG